MTILLDKNRLDFEKVLDNFKSTRQIYMGLMSKVAL